MCLQMESNRQPEVARVSKVLKQLFVSPLVYGRRLCPTFPDIIVSFFFEYGGVSISSGLRQRLSGRVADWRGGGHFSAPPFDSSILFPRNECM